MRARPARSESVEPRPVIPEDPARGGLGQREPEELLGRPRILGVAVRVVGGEDDVVRERLRRVAAGLLVALDRRPARALEVLARRAREVRRLDGATPLDVLVHPPEEPGRPAAVALEEGDAEAGVALEDAAHAHADARLHHLERVAHHVTHDPPVESLAGLLDVEPEIGGLEDMHVGGGGPESLLRHRGPSPSGRTVTRPFALPGPRCYHSWGSMGVGRATGGGGPA